MNFKFGNWKKFRESIKQQDLSIVTFDFKYYTCEFRIIYALAQNIFIIALKGTQKGFVLNLKGYEILSTVNNDLYKELVKCKNIPFDKNKPYSPWDFFVELNNHIGKNLTFEKTSKVDYASASSNAIPDEKKRFFQRWIPHISDDRNVTDKNLAKIEKLLGYNIRMFCEKNNTSIGFQEKPSERSINVLTDFEKDYKEQKEEE